MSEPLSTPMTGERRPPPRELVASLEELVASLALEVVAETRVAPGEPEATAVPWPRALDPRVKAAFRAQGISAPWRHQAETIKGLLARRHVVLASPTASGKSLPYLATALHRLVEDSEATALYLAPTKALAQDQMRSARLLVEAVLGDQSVAQALDGDSSAADRRRAREQARILYTNPEMLHHAILPTHLGWRRFLGGLCLVVLDEVHVFRGVFGAHVAQVLRRLWRLAALHGAGREPARVGGEEARQPVVFAASATIANPGEHAARLVGAEVEELQGEPARRAPLQIVLARPQRLEPRGGPRPSPRGSGGGGEPAPILGRPPPEIRAREPLQSATARVTGILTSAGLRVLVFAPTRAQAERTAAAIQGRAGVPDGAEETEPHREEEGPHRVRVYRAGLPSGSRRQVERALRAGTATVVVATSALELGVDPGEMDACVLMGIPGSRTRFWQRVGRVGRRDRPGLAVCIAGSRPEERLLLRQPAWLLGTAREQATLDPETPSVRLAHLACAAFERPLRPEELESGPLAPSGAESLAAALERLSTIRRFDGRWYWVGAEPPASQVSLRGATDQRVSVRLAPEAAVAGPEGTGGAGAHRGAPLDEVGQWEAPLRLHPGAIHRVGGEVYRVRRLDLERLEAEVAPGPPARMTVPRVEHETRLARVAEGRTLASGLRLLLGTVAERRQVMAYREMGPGAGEPIRSVDLALDATERVSEGVAVLGFADLALDGGRGPLARLDRSAPSGRGPGWQPARAAARRRDGYRCQLCGVDEPAGRQHDVHHLRPFRRFGWVPGQNEANREANRVENLVTLCPSCHRRVEAEGATWSLASRLGALVRAGAAAALFCDLHDLEARVTELEIPESPASLPVAGTPEASDARAAQPPQPAQTTRATLSLVVLERAGAGAGLAVALYDGFEGVARRIHQSVSRCTCLAGCPECVGPPDEDLADPRGAVLALLGALGGGAPTGAQGVEGRAF